MVHVAAAAGAIGLVGSRASLAANRTAPHITVTRLRGTDDCPDAVALAKALAHASESGPPEVARDPNAAPAFDVMFARDKSAYVATVRGGALAGERTIVSKGPTCAALADALAVAIEVMLDNMPETTDAAPAPPGPADSSASQATEAPDAAAPESTPPAEPSRPSTPSSSRAPAPADDGVDEPYRRHARNVFFVELLGSGIAYSVNYERFFSDEASLRLGVGYIEENWPPVLANQGAPRNSQTTIPVLANYYSPSSPNGNLHIASGATFVYRSAQLANGLYDAWNAAYGAGDPGVGFSVLADIVVGYRYLPPAGGVTFGLDAILLFNNIGAFPWVGANAGVAF
jgi:hypothetical protein